MKLLDAMLDRITMYRLLIYYLVVILCGALLLGAFDVLPYSPIAITLTTGYLLLVCWAANRIFAHVFAVPHNPESSIITALILALIITPLASPQNFLFLSAAGGLAVASKYLLNIRGKHIFNPAAVAVALTAFGAGDSASWWVGNAYLMPLVVLGGLLVVRKLRDSYMVGTFFIAASLTVCLFTFLAHGDVLSSLQKTVFHSSLFFLGFVMLTEPLTSPGQRTMQRWYAVIVGILFVPQIHLGSIYSTPELALVIGNIFAYIVSPKAKSYLRLKKRIRLGPSTYDYVFAAARPFDYKPGQYMEFTLPHHEPDNRGVRRYFTLASSPTEPDLHVGVRFNNPSSTFKRTLLAMDASVPIVAGQLSGDFTLPDNLTQSIVLIAGGIGITPYRSMLKYVLDRGEKRPMTLIYAERNIDEIAYQDVLSEALQAGVTVVCTLTDTPANPPQGYRHGSLNAALLKEVVSDFQHPIFYISGPHGMVTDVNGMLLDLSVPRHHIKTDFFPGYV